MTSREGGQQRSVLRIYALYRLTLALILLITFFLAGELSVIGSTAPQLFVLVGIGYLIFSVLVIARHALPRQRYNYKQLFFEFFIDIAGLTLLSYGSASAESGLPLLLVVTVSAASMTLPSQISLLSASLASIAVLGDVLATSLHERVETQEFVVAGMLGIAYFTTAIVIRYLTAQIAETELLADQRRTDLEALSQINQQIVQHMQTGIVVMNAEGHIRLLNAAAAQLLDLPYRAVPEALQAPQELVALLSGSSGDAAQLSLKNSRYNIQVSWSRLDQSRENDYLLYIDDTSKITQRAQNLKLASLGRFSASIAHEIRNPLGAISHAAQLLDESPKLEQADQRFVSIIQNHVTRMNNIIQNILELSRGRAPEPLRFSLQEWLQDFISDWQSGGDNRTRFSIEWYCDSDIVNVDPNQLRQIVNNLTENGVRYGAATNDYAEIRYVISTSTKAGAIKLALIDNGPGVNPENEEKLFEPFFTTETKGNGLGLYLSRELCLANQISIFYQRTDDGSSCFHLQFAHPNRGTLVD